MDKGRSCIQWRPDILLIVWQAAFLAVTMIIQSVYLFGCGILLLLLGGFRLLTRKRRGPWSSFLLLLPASALCVLSAVPLFMPLLPVFHIQQACIFVVLIAFQIAAVIFSLITGRAEKGAEAWTCRHFDFALLCVLLSALVSQLLLFGNPNEWAQMVCLTGCVMGGVLLLLGSNLLLCSLSGYRDTRESIRLIRKELKDRRRLFHFVSVGKDGFLVLVKLVLSLVSASFFMFSNALFSCGIGLARYMALNMQGKESAEQLRLYRLVAVILSFSGLCYAGYSVRLFFGGSAGQYSEVMALAIAAYTFVEFGIQIHELLKLRKHHDLEAEALRLVSFCGILVSFVLTQTAIMSFSEPGEHNFSDGLAGIVFGGLVVLVGFIALLRCKYQNTKTG